MKYLLVFAIIFVVAWRWRADRLHDKLHTRQKRASAVPVDMVACALCGVHIPANEAHVGHQGRYCSAAHLQKAEH